MRPSKLIAAVENGIINLSSNIRRSMRASALLRAKDVQAELEANATERKLVEQRLNELLAERAGKNAKREAKRAAEALITQAEFAAVQQARTTKGKTTGRTPRGK